MTTKYTCDHCGHSYTDKEDAIKCESTGAYTPHTEYPKGLMYEYHHHGFVGIFAIAEDNVFDTNKHLGQHSLWACRTELFNCGDSLGNSLCGSGSLIRSGEKDKWIKFHKITDAKVGCPEYIRMVNFLKGEGITPTYYNEAGELVTLQ